MNDMDKNRIYRILLLTNRDSDNVGDQVIEACDISLLSTVMKNLNISEERYEIKSHAAGIISKKYLETREPEFLKFAESLIAETDLIVFGGAPLFNYRYQVFYERTAITLELAQKYNKPVIFSAIGVEGYDEDNEKCQRLKKTLNFECVKQITTRDDFDSLKQFIENKSITIDKVSDPAVFASNVFENYVSQNKEKNKIGIFILRANGFRDNKVDFSRNDAALLWKDLISKLDSCGYDYELITSGHFGDEAFLDYLIKRCGVNEKKCVFNINSPEKLIEKISSYDAVVSTRLHPSIISFSLEVPSIGIVWNPKVNQFYESIGYEDRIIETENISSEIIVESIEKALNEGVYKDTSFLYSIYYTLFNGIKAALIGSDDNIEPYKYDKLVEEIVLYSGTSTQEQQEKLKRKFRRTYGKYNDLFDKNVKQRDKITELKSEIKALKKENEKYRIFFRLKRKIKRILQ